MVLLGQCWHALAFYGGIYALATRRSPRLFFAGLPRMWITAFGTSSSAATLSTTIRCCEARSNLPSIFPRPRRRRASRSPSALAASPPRSAQELGVSKEAINFVLPVGCTVNMDGGALERPLVVLWIAHVAGCPLAFGQQLVVALTAALLSVGSSPIPSAGALSTPPARRPPLGRTTTFATTPAP